MSSKTKNIILILLISSSCNSPCQSQSFRISEFFSYAELQDYGSPPNVGDYDNDGDLDIIVPGPDSSRIFRNDGNDNYSKITLSIPGLGSSYCDLGDFDNDKDLDLLITGSTSGFWWGELMTRVYSNKGDGTFENLDQTFPELYFGAGKWFDYNNDGRLDFYICGTDRNKDQWSHLFQRTKNGVFNEASIQIRGLDIYPPGIADFDKDGDKDMLLSGRDISGNNFRGVFRNENFEEFTEIRLDQTIDFGPASWGDYNGDGFPDILVTGSTTKLFLNDKGVGFYDSNYPIPNYSYTDGAFIDFDCDGDLDILLTGQDSNWNKFSELIVNEGSDSISIVPTNITSPLGTSLIVGDFNLDDRQDVFVYGLAGHDSCIFHLFYNETNCQNTAPLPPEELNVEIIGGVTNLSWSKGHDFETPRNSLQYSIRIGTYQGWEDVYSSHSNIASGQRKLVGLDNLINDTVFRIHGLEEGIYYWSVQTIDNSAKGSIFSSEEQFMVLDELTSMLIDTIQFDCIELADYDEDNDLDILAMGNVLTYNRDYPDSEVLPVVKLFSNNGTGEFTRLATNFVDFDNCFFDWGDYDNDNDLDIIISGNPGPDSSIAITRIYQNHGSDGFIEKDFGLPGLSGGANAWPNKGKVRWVDLDNDGDLDILLFGMNRALQNNLSNRLLCYENINGSEFILKDVLDHYFTGGFTYADLDNDFDFDIIYFGMEGDPEYPIIPPETKIYLNHGNWDLKQSDTLIAMSNGDIGVCDYNNDGFIDILASGRFSTGNHTFLYTNNGDLSFEPASGDLMGAYEAQVNWLDFNNDGLADFSISGGSFDKIRFFINDGENQFDRVHLGLDGSSGAYTRSGDLDNDGDIDLAHSNNALFVFRNNGNWPNNPPTAPANLQSYLVGSGVVLDWDEASDNQSTTGGLTYNVRIGTTEGGTEIMPPMSDLTTGFRFVPKMGNVQQNTGWRIDSLPVGTYYWSVQAIDHSYAGGEWAEEQIFEILSINIDFDVDTTCMGTPVQFVDKSLVRGAAIDSWNWDFGGGNGSAEQHPVYIFQSSGNKDITLTVTQNGNHFSKTKQIFIKSSPEIDFTADGECIGSLTTLTNNTDTSGLSISSWLWDFGDGITSSVQNPQSHGYVSPGSYNIKLTAVAGNGCSETLNEFVTIIPKPEGKIYSEGLPCEDGSYVLRTEDEPSYSYQWKYNGTDIPGETESYHIPDKSGEYSVVITSSCGETSDSYNVGFLIGPPKPEVFIKGPEVWFLACSNDSVDYYQWYRNGELIPGAEEPIFVADQQLGEYYVSISNEGECFTNSDPVTIPLGATTIEEDPFSALKIYPNPTPGIFNIEMDYPIMGELLIDIFNELGGKVINIKFLKQTSHFLAQVDLSSQSAGIYLIGLKLDKYSTNRSLVVE